jgi:hypothetical protein
MGVLFKISNQIAVFVKSNTRNVFLFISCSLLIHQCSLKSNYIHKYNLQTDKNLILVKQIDSLNSLLKEAEKEISFLENRFNDESAIAEQFALLEMNRLKTRKFSGKISHFYPNGNKYIQGTLVNGDERGRWEYYNIDKSINVIYDYPLVCVGSQCCDGTTSSSVGRGTCSWHGGVCATLYEYRKRYLNIGGEPQ